MMRSIRRHVIPVLLLTSICIMGKVNASAYEIGDHIVMGKYEQDGDLSNGEEPIEWRVLGQRDDGLIVIAEYGLDAMSYHSERVSVTWEDSNIRKWLNETFYETAFSDSEKESIMDTYLINEDSYMNIYAGNDTMDKIFLLSIQEAVEYFENAEDKVAHPTKQAFLNGCYSSDGINMYMTKELAEDWGREENTYVSEYSPDACCPWWLRNPGGNEETKAFVFGNGNTEVKGDGVDNTYNAVRPVMRISLNQ